MKNKTYKTTARERGRPFLMGAAALTLAATVSVSHADTIVDNLPQTISGTNAFVSYVPNNGPGSEYAQAFLMPSTTDTILSSITLDLSFSAASSATIDIYSATLLGVPTGSALASLGVVSGSTANDDVSLTGLSFALTPGDSYAIVMELNPDVSWNFTSPNASSGGTADALPNQAFLNGSTWQTGHSTEHQQMEIITTSPPPEPTPEPSTLALAGLGGVASFFMFRRRH